MAAREVEIKVPQKQTKAWNIIHRLEMIIRGKNIGRGREVSPRKNIDNKKFLSEK